MNMKIPLSESIVIPKNAINRFSGPNYFTGISSFQDTSQSKECMGTLSAATATDIGKAETLG